MKYICFYESVDAEETIKRMRKLREISKEYKEEDKKMKAETAYNYADMSGGFQIIETDDFVNLTELAMYYFGATNIKIIPIVETSKLEEIYEETKQYW
jgi:hypothetical protein